VHYARVALDNFQQAGPAPPTAPIARQLIADLERRRR
jgi:hypothetical protein